MTFNVSADDVIIKLFDDRNQSTHEDVVTKLQLREKTEKAESYNLSREFMDKVKTSSSILEIHPRRHNCESFKKCYITKITVIKLVRKEN